VLAVHLISETIPFLLPSDTGQQALNLMDEFQVSHLPVVQNKAYIGLISGKFVEDMNLSETQLDTHNQVFPAPHVHPQQHIFEVASIMYKLNLSLIPVVDDAHNYLGSVILSDLSHQLMRLLSIPEPGGVIVLQIQRHNYSASQISQIIEGNDARILSMTVIRLDETDNLEVTIKLDRVDISAVVQTFTRYDYQIAAVYMDDSMLHTLYEDRLELFLRYMNM
jgi:acetoin utilization protein AcuB